MVRRTLAEWEELRKQRQQVADAQRITYGTFESVKEHTTTCSVCQYITQPYSFCEVGLNIFQTFPNYEICEMGNLTCARCGKEWE